MIRRPTTAQVLSRLVEQGVLSDARRLELQQLPPVDEPEHTPWFVRLLVGAGAWVAALLFVVFLFLSGLVESGGSAMAVGLVVVVGATILRKASTHDFATNLALAGCITGEILCIGSASGEGETEGALFALVSAITLLVVYPDPVMRFLAAAAVPGSLFVLLLEAEQPVLVDLLVVAAMVGGGLLWLSPSRSGLAPSRFGERRVPMAYGFLLFGLALMVADLAAAHESYREPWMSRQFTTAGLGIFFFLLARWLLQANKVRKLTELTGVVLVATGLVCAATLNSPGVLASLTVFALAFQGRSKVLLGLAILFLCGFVVFFYYNLNATLLAKSGMLLGAGLTLFALRVYLGLRFRVTEVQSS